MVENHPQFRSAFDQASRELGLEEYFQDLVLPLFSMPVTQWPACCAGNCLPCAQTLVAVALRTCQLLEVDPARF